VARLRASSPGQRAILGLNYSGLHDTAIALVSPAGQVLYAASLERLSRVKQDGRPPGPLLEGLPWDVVDGIALSTEEFLPPVPASRSVLHPQELPAPRNELRAHGAKFLELLDALHAPKTFVCHHLSHAASAFWPSGFDEALCLTYDGGMWNSPWFGGLYEASRAAGIRPLDRFCAAHYAKISSLYSVVTAILGFSPNKHEGKITGLAAFGAPSARCRRILDRLFERDYSEMESLVEWVDVYSTASPPAIAVDTAVRETLRARFGGIPKEEIAATLQQMTEEHVLEILRRARQRGWVSTRLCLAGGLFANVRLNQRLKETGFDDVFVAPAMTDDGTAVGAALVAASVGLAFQGGRTADVFWGPEYHRDEVEATLQASGVKYSREADPAALIVDALIAGQAVAMFQRRMEFGPRALGNRSILSAATNPHVTADLNARLRRTEFMPFAPMTRVEDLDDCYLGLEGASRTAEFMTISCCCTTRMTEETPAVVHVDGTARPQIVRRDVHPLLHDILTRYRARSGLLALVNTSFNVHEEPIVCSPSDAIRGFLEAGLDVLYLDGGYVVRGAGNEAAAAAVLRERLADPTQKELHLTALNDHLYRQAGARLTELQRKQEWGMSLNRAAQELLEQLQEKERVIRELAAEADRLRSEAVAQRRRTGSE
jgi:carbamoyltransferase